MGEFFKGWRRKAGLVTLAMACALTVGWMRSCVVYDSLEFTMCGSQFDIRPLEGVVQLQMWDLKGEEGTNSWHSYSLDRQEDMVFARSNRQGNSLLARFLYDDIEELSIPYWSLVLPLALLSAWLIFGKRTKPRAADSGASQI